MGDDIRVSVASQTSPPKTEQTRDSSVLYDRGTSIFRQSTQKKKPVEYFSCPSISDDGESKYEVCPRPQEQYFEGDEEKILESPYHPIDDMHVKFKYQHYDSLVRFNPAVMVVNLRGLKKEQKVAYSKKNELQKKVNLVVAPFCWKRGSCLWIREVSVAAATREDVQNLEHKFATRLHVTQARATGICGIRRSIFTQCFDECIRQVMVNCPQRGELFVEVRNELNKSLAFLNKLYSSAMAFGLRKSLYEKEIRENLKKKYLEFSRGRRPLFESFESIRKELKKEAESNEAERETLREEYDIQIADLTVEVIGLRDKLWSYAQIPPEEDVPGRKRLSSKLKPTS